MRSLSKPTGVRKKSLALGIKNVLLLMIETVNGKSVNIYLLASLLSV